MIYVSTRPIVNIGLSGFEKGLSLEEIKLVGYLIKYFDHYDAGYIITKLVINGWPIDDYIIKQ